MHRTADGRHLLVTHGDRFDNIESQLKWLSVLRAASYDFIQRTNSIVNWARKHLKFTGRQNRRVLEARVNRVVKYINRFEERLAQHAQDRLFDGVICGHVHAPAIRSFDEVVYFNAGDWVENCTALVEGHDGVFEIVRVVSKGDDVGFESEGNNGNGVEPDCTTGPQHLVFETKS